MISFTEAYSEIGNYFTAKITSDMPIHLAQSVADSLVEEFADFGIRLTVKEAEGGPALEMGLNGELLLPLLQEVRKRKMALTEVR